jgi:hypothetical protein
MPSTNPQPQTLEPGTVMADDSVYAGVSPDTGKRMYAMSSDASVLMTFNEAASHAKALDTLGHDDWRVPTASELNELFNHAVAIGGFDMTGQGHATWYWSSNSMNGDPDDIGAICQRFSDGFAEPGYKTDPLSIRFVRDDDAEMNTRAELEKAKAEELAQSRSAEEIQGRLHEKAQRFRLMPQKGDCSPWKPCK